MFGVIKKYGDDNGGVLAGSLARSGFVSLFPLLLVLVTILGLIASGDPSLRQEALTAVAKQVPLIGHQLAGNVHQLRRSSVIGLVAGLLALTWGTTGLAQAGLHTMAQVWNLPGPGSLAATGAHFQAPADSCQTRVRTLLKHVLQFPAAHSPPVPSGARPVTSNFRGVALAGILVTVQARPFQCPTASVVPFFAFLTAPPTQTSLSLLASTLLS